MAIEIPRDLVEVKQAGGDFAARWRRATREAFLETFDRGYHVCDFQRAGRGLPPRYLLRTAE